MSYFSEKLRALRREHGLSQGELAAQLGMTKSRINMYERGEREPKFAVASQIASYFGIDLNELIGAPRTAHIDRIGGGDEDPTSLDALSPDEQKLIAAYRTMPQAGRDYLRQVMTLAALMNGK